MPPLNQQRLDQAQQLAAQLAQNPHVKASMVTGSVAKGIADDSSDIDLITYYDQLPSKAEYEAMLASARASGGDLYGYDPEHGFAYYRYIDGLRHDFAHAKLEEAAQMVNEFLAAPSLDNTNLLITISGIATGRPLIGSDILQQWQTALEAYPPKLTQLLVEKHLRFPPRWVLQRMGADRDEVIFLTEELLKVADNVFNVLCGLNQIYPPGKIKGLDFFVQQMHIAPSDLDKRLPRLFTVDLHTAVAEASTLVEETIDLVETYLPDFDTQPVRTRWTMQLRKS